MLQGFSVSGIRLGLKMLTVLFIGGASGSAQLLGCQRTDGAGAFNIAMGAFQILTPISQSQLKRCKVGSNLIRTLELYTINFIDNGDFFQNGKVNCATVLMLHMPLLGSGFVACFQARH